MEISMKKQIAVAALFGSLVAAGGMLWEEPTFGATPDVQAAFSPDGGGEHLVLQTIYSARQSVRVMAYSFTAPAVVKAQMHNGQSRRTLGKRDSILSSTRLAGLVRIGDVNELASIGHKRSVAWLYRFK
jgi:hypothetical protein